MSNKTPLTAEQERNLFNLFRKAIGVAGSYEDWFIEFGRLYHTEASKAGMSGEVKSAEELFELNWAKYYVLAGNPVKNVVVGISHEYAAQFQKGWRPIEEYDNSELFVPVGWQDQDVWEWTKAFFRDGAWFERVDKEVFPTHYFPIRGNYPLPPPPNDKP
jgi:hypothetical protein